ncbi:hypothetical protein WG66_004454, partial [Moniliophthora roreri]
LSDHRFLYLLLKFFPTSSTLLQPFFTSSPTCSPNNVKNWKPTRQNEAAIRESDSARKFLLVGFAGILTQDDGSPINIGKMIYRHRARAEMYHRTLQLQKPRRRFGTTVTGG